MNSNNYRELAIEKAYPELSSYKQLSFLENLIFWVDNLSNPKENRNAIFVKLFKSDSSSVQNLTGEDFYIKSNFHGYGGKSYQCFYFQKKFYLIWIDQITKSIWSQIYSFHYKNGIYLKRESNPRQLTLPLEGNYDANFILFKGKKLFGLLERNNKDYLFSIDINLNKQQVKIVKEFIGFSGSLGCNQNQTIFSWIEWDTKNMSWEKNNLFFAEVDSVGDLKKVVKFNYKNINFANKVSFFQPYWISNNILICSEDSSGWWNLLFLNINQIDKINIKKRILKESFEYGMPEWVSGISLFSGSINNLFCLAKNNEYWILEHYRNCIFHKKIDLPFTSLKDLHVSENRLVCIASSDLSHDTLLELDTCQPLNIFISPQEISSDKLNSYSKADSYWFKGYLDQKTHAWLYRPHLINEEKPPLIVKVHGGPTALFTGELNLEVQYWLSRGWFVAEVNYGGSSGFGRQYRERLNKKWGISDPYDCKLLVQSLLDEQLVDPSRIFITGSSAGGFTALNALYRNDIFRAAICKYPVIDLNEMHLNTHRFEQNYLNSLIGDYEIHKKQYFERSPKNNIHNINKPILLFHGKIDSVIHYKESLEFNKKLLENNIYSKLVLFDDEGHGFKKLKNKRIVLQKTEEFIQYILNVKN